MSADPTASRTADAWATTHTIVSTAQPDRRAPSVYVEGTTDRLALMKFLTVGEAHTHWTKGKPNLLKAVEALRQSEAVGIVDADYDRVNKLPARYPGNIILLDCHDYEAMVLRSRALDHIVAEFQIRVAVPPGHPSDLGARADLLRDVLLRLALPVGRLRWHSLCRNWYMSFREIAYASLVDQAEWEPDIEALVESVVKQVPKVSWKELWKHATTPVQNEDPWEMCRGHDLTEFLALYMSQRCKNGKQFTRDDVEHDLRLAFDSQYFANTDAYCQLWGWSLTHKFRLVQMDAPRCLHPERLICGHDDGCATML